MFKYLTLEQHTHITTLLYSMISHAAHTAARSAVPTSRLLAPAQARRFATIRAAKMAEAATTSGFYSLTTNTLDGKPFAFSSLQGKVVMVVNVASK